MGLGTTGSRKGFEDGSNDESGNDSSEIGWPWTSDHDGDGNGGGESASDSIFLNGLGNLWRPSHVIAVPSNGVEIRDQDLYAYLSSASFRPESVREQLATQRIQVQTGDARPFSCRSSAACICSLNIASAVTLYNTILPGDHFRILEILPGLENRLNCRLHTACLSENTHSYEALSYTWKDPNQSCYRFLRSVEPGVQPSIICNGIHVPVSWNLFSALRALRYGDRSRFIWADALCINQNDNTELSHQVQRMSPIFENASRVVVWLGIDEDGVASNAFSGVCDVVNTWRERAGHTDLVSPATFSPGTGATDDQTASKRGLLSADSLAWHSILALYERSWFSRTWVIQEAALARDALVVWGGCNISWEWVGLAAAIVRTNFGRLSAQVRMPTDYNLGGMIARRRVPEGVVNTYFIYRVSKSQRLYPPLQFTFHQLLQLTRHFHCQDNRDRVFGLLGLPTSDGVSKRIIADYTKPVGEVYFQVACHILDCTGSIVLLSSARFISSRNNISGLEVPSWVPYWSEDAPSSLSPMQRHPSFAASAGRPLQRCSGSDPRRLILGGIVVDEVLGCSSSYSALFQRDKEDVDRGLLKRAGVKEWLKRYPICRDQLEAAALTVTGGKNWYGLPVEDVSAHLSDYAKCLVRGFLLWTLASCTVRPLLKMDVERASGLVERSPYGKVNYKELEDISRGGAPERFLEAAAAARSFRRTFTTRSGKVDIGSNDVRMDDSIFVAYGADVPFIIRKGNEGYLLIGECYVRDFMGGEAVRQLDRGEKGLAEVSITFV
ncbi:hypothetical protein DL769_002449 [Monosporascus sp. CRB-8-3]|nr:hypothetical protein DL769_002449 [Monosporascus sp. CRB-8-3]